eukprot:87189-Chlamydomonas_euryale.AAC.1
MIRCGNVVASIASTALGRMYGVAAARLTGLLLHVPPGCCCMCRRVAAACAAKAMLHVLPGR